MKRISFILTALMLLSFGLAHSQNHVTLDSVGPYISPSIPLPSTGAKFTFRWEWHTNPGDGLGGFSIGYDLYSPDGAGWTSLAGAWHPDFQPVRTDFGNANTFINPFSNNGTGNDTIGFSGFDGQGDTTQGQCFGCLVNWNSKSTILTTGAIALSDTNKHICIDSVTAYGVGGDWSFGGGIAFGVYNPDWGGGPFAAQYTPGQGYCFTLFKPANQNPVFTTCPPSATGSHCAILTASVAANDPDGPSVTYSVTAGVGTVNATTGAWSYQPTCANVGQNLSSTVTATNILGGTATCTFNVVVTNVAPQITDGCGSNAEVGIGTSKSIDLDDTPGDCDVSTWSLGTVSPALNSGTVSVDANGNVTLNTTPTTTAGVYTVPVIATDCAGGADTCNITFTVVSVTPFQVRIEKTHGTIQGQHEYVDVILESGSPQMGGFDFLIAYDNSALNFVGAIPGPEFYNQSSDNPSGCGWEYFSYRYSAFGNCGGACASGKVRVDGIAETNNGANHPDCYTPANLPAVIFTLDFLVTDNRTFECQYVPVRFVWFDCGDNTISDKSGDTLYISRKVVDFDLIGEIQDTVAPWLGYPTFQGAQDCHNSDTSKPSPIRLIDFYNGGIDIACADSIDDRGDINLNDVSNEIADAVLYSNYFVHGLGVFTVNVAGQTAASDVNADGIPLSVADLVYLIRIVIGDANPYPKVSPAAINANYSVVNGEISIDTKVAAASVVVAGNVTPTLLVNNMDMKYEFDGTNTHILVFTNVLNSQTIGTFSGAFLANIGTVVSADFATPEGGMVNAAGKVLPSNFTLNQNYPNPFNPKTKISFSMPKASEYTLTIYNITGQKVKEIAGSGQVGLNEVEWDASGEASGVYFYKLNAGTFSSTKKMVFLK